MFPSIVRYAHNLHCIRQSIRYSSTPITPFSAFRSRFRSTIPPSAPKAFPNQAVSKSASPGKLPRIPNLRTSPAITTPSQITAQRLFENGQTSIFRAPSHTTFLITSYVLGFGCICGSVAMLVSGHWKQEEDLGLPWFVPMSYRISMFFLTFLGGWAIMRSTGQIMAIDLIPASTGVNMSIKIRRAFPLLRPKTIQTEPSNVVLPSRMVAQLAIPKWAEPSAEPNSSWLSRLSNWIGMGFWAIFSANRKLFTHEGFMDVTIKGKNGQWKLDTSGTFHRDGRSLIEMSSFEE